jgi:hypothetical protein
MTLRTVPSSGFASEARVASDLGNAFGAGDVSQGGCHQGRVAFLQGGFQIGHHVLVVFEMLGRIP